MLNKNDAAVVETHVLLQKVNEGLDVLQKTPLMQKTPKAESLLSGMRDLLAKLTFENHRLSNEIERLKAVKNG